MWEGRFVLVAGGASFIGSHLVDSLLKKGSIVRVADDFSSGKLEHMLRKRGKGGWTCKNLSVHRVDPKERRLTRKLMEDVDVVFHLAAQHGGRGYFWTRRRARAIWL